jgi:hypothetical protein
MQNILVFYENQDNIKIKIKNANFEILSFF